MSDLKSAYLQKQLLLWFRRSARILPWRKNKDPYKVWIAEIMLQQTQVATVIPYYERWLKRFPDLKTFAKAPLLEALKYWAGLGYYRRVRMAHLCARKIGKDFSGRFPETAAELKKLPGIGAYTAGAVASIAFERPEPIVDGNVIRILSRIYALPEDVGESATLKKIWHLASTLVPENHPGNFNQAMMELGATVCFPETPLCRQCPVSTRCEAYRRGDPSAFPVKLAKEKLIKLKNAALILRKNGKVLIRRQPRHGRWGGLWMFPFWESKLKMLRETGLKPNAVKKKMTVKHGFTKYSIQLEVFDSGHQKTVPLLKPSSRWVKTAELKNYAFPSAHQKIAETIQS